MLSTVLLALTLAFSASAQKENPAEQYYRELNCKPIIEAGETKPTRYDCSHLAELKEDQCYHNGKFYKEGNELPNTEVSPCVRDCNCRNDYGKAEFRCINIECPTLFGVRPKDGCYFEYELGKCCYTKERCEAEGEVASCEWDGKIYKEGQSFSPSGSCMNCVCMKGFNGTLGAPWCRKFSCDLNIHYGARLREGCVPTYYTVNDCCPIPVFRCPSEEDKIEGEPVATAKSGDQQCVFGQLKVAKGQKLNVDPENKCVRCSCEVPPHLTCTMDRQCYESDFPSDE